MSRRYDWVSLQQMLDHAQEAVEFARGKAKQDLASDRLLQLGLVRLVEIVGEAARRVSPETQLKYPEIPWAKVNGMRNRLVHGYDEINLDTLWDTVTEDLPALLSALPAVLARIEPP
jgi:uncharacterized protein with HEPN domain